MEALALVGPGPEFERSLVLALIECIQEVIVQLTHTLWDLRCQKVFNAGPTLSAPNASLRLLPIAQFELFELWGLVGTKQPREARPEGSALPRIGWRAIHLNELTP